MKVCAATTKMCKKLYSPGDEDWLRGTSMLNDFFEFVSEILKWGNVLEIKPNRFAALLEALMAGRVVRPRHFAHPRLAILGTLEARLQTTHNACWTANKPNSGATQAVFCTGLGHEPCW